MCEELLSADEDLVAAALFAGLPTNLLASFRERLASAARADAIELREIATRRLLDDFEVPHDVLFEVATEETDGRLRRSTARALCERVGLVDLLERVDTSCRDSMLRDLRDAGVVGLQDDRPRAHEREGELVEYGFFDPPTRD